MYYLGEMVKDYLAGRGAWVVYDAALYLFALYGLYITLAY